MSQQKNAYQYAGLPRDKPWMRVMVLHAGSSLDEISITIRQERLDGSCSYEALSYVWGSVVDKPETITVNGAKELPITTNLSSALRYLRYPAEERVLWVDAICINQEDLTERGHQVAYMHRIYQQATTVQIWLGLEADDSEFTMKQLDGIGSAVQTAWTKDVRWVLLPRNTDDYSRMLASFTQQLDLSERLWQGLHSFFTRPWFERVWIRQEINPANVAFFDVTLANPVEAQADHMHQPDIDILKRLSPGSSGAAQLICGNSTMSWWNLRNAMTCFQMKLMVGKLGPRTIPISNKARFRLSLVQSLCQTRVYSWASLVRDLRYTKCTDSRDRIYAVCSMMAAPDAPLVITPDYTRPAVDVYRDVVLPHIKHSKSLDILRHCVGTGTPGHPSWIPDWMNEDPPHLGFNDNSRQFLASSHFYADVGAVGHDAIEVPAVVIDSVDKTFPPFSQVPQSTEERLASECWETIIPGFMGNGNLRDECPGGGTYLSAILDLLTFRNVSETEHPPSDIYPKREMAKQMIELLVYGCLVSHAKHAEETARSIDEGEFNKLRDSIWSASAMNYGLCRTEKGYLCMVPSWTTQGDVVAVLIGSEIPFVLRRIQTTSGSSTAQYRIVGPCYVHGFMDGEALLGPLPPGVETVSEVRTVQRKFRDSESGLLDLADPRIMAVFSEDKLHEYRESLKVAQHSRMVQPKLRVGIDSLSELGVQAQVLRLV